MSARRAFTLIELLIVVAIIAILAAIALPNFLEAQTRAKVARVHADLRTLIGAIEAYRVDHNRYPPHSGTGPYVDFPFTHPVSLRLIPLTTPVAYITSIPQDPYSPVRIDEAPGADPFAAKYDTYDLVTVPDTSGHGSEISSGGMWRIMSPGPDLIQAFGGLPANTSYTEANVNGVDYDPTNGTRSVGELVRVGSVVPTAHGGSPSDLSNPERPGILRVPFYREQFQ
ncbi:prepilin-type N-terminal cleavage/methylation domain-containing protein [Candidatus Sumerlaeota bacterium]|nr:prepilin-type N-terminal cleavage/methylation domain-containing protein [Candidatus Sumerlaeota bacterium]